MLIWVNWILYNNGTSHWHLGTDLWLWELQLFHVTKSGPTFEDLSHFHSHTKWRKRARWSHIASMTSTFVCITVWMIERSPKIVYRNNIDILIWKLMVNTFSRRLGNLTFGFPHQYGIHLRLQAVEVVGVCVRFTVRHLFGCVRIFSAKSQIFGQQRKTWRSIGSFAKNICNQL